MNGFVVFTYVSIWWVVSDAYGVTPEEVNLLSLVTNMAYIPGSILSVFLYAKFGLSHCLIGGALLNFMALWIRCVASLSYNAPTVVDVYGKYDGLYAAANTSALPYPITDSKVARNAFDVQIFAQIVAALAQPLLLNAPPRIANDWFPKGERDLAMHMMTQSNSIGYGIAAIVPPIQAYSGRSLSFMLLWSALAGTAVLALNLVASPFLYLPPVHAEFDAYHQQELRKDVDASTVVAVFRQMLVDFRTMLTDFNFVLLLTAFTVEQGTGWVFAGISSQLIGPCGYNENIMSGTLTGFNFAGVVGSFILANVLRVWHRGRSTVQKVSYFVACGACLWCLGANRPGNVYNVVAAYTVYGMIAGPLIPITLEYAAEMTYPIPADNSAALLFVGVNYFALFVTLGVARLLATDPVSRTCSSIASQAAIMLMVFAIFGAVVLLPIKPTYRRATLSEKANDQPLKSPRIMPR